MILLIDNYDSFTFNLYQLLAQHAEVKVVRNDKITLAQIEELRPEGIVISPGPGRPEEAGIIVEAIRAFGGKIPLFGVCLGHQAIALAFGGFVTSAPAIVHGKSSQIFHCRQNLFKELPLPFAAGRYHSLLVDKASLPQELVIEAENSEGLIMAMRHRDYPVFGVQFHPESILTPEGKQLIEAFVALCARSKP